MEKYRYDNKKLKLESCTDIYRATSFLNKFSLKRTSMGVFQIDEYLSDRKV